MGLALGPLLVALCLGGPAPAEPPGSTEPTEPTEHARPRELQSPRYDIVVDGMIASAPSVREELTLRMADRDVTSTTQAELVAPSGPFVWVTLGSSDVDTVEVRLIVSDGRLFARTVDAPADQRARVVAGTVANMVDAIEKHRLQPLETGVDVPVSRSTDPPVPETAPASKPVETAEPDLPLRFTPPWWVGPVLGPSLTLGLGPPRDVRGVTDISGRVSLQAVHQTGAMVAFEVKAGAWQDAGVRLTRLRLSAVAGYAWRPGRYELLTAIGPTVEATFVDVALFTPDGAPRSNTPLLGGRALARPAYLVFDRPGRIELLVGVEAEASVAFEARSPTGAIQIVRPIAGGTEPIMRAGGFELGIALTLDGRFAVGTPNPVP